MLIQNLSFLLLFGVALTQAAVAESALKVGDTVPSKVILKTEDNKEVNLRSLLSEKPGVLIFYRGGWCPFCTRHLADLVGIEKDLEKAGVQLLAISMDQPSVIKATPGRDKLGYRLLSDSDAQAAKAFGIAFKVDEATVEKYEGYGIDLNAASGKDHHILPHPAVYVVDKQGVIQYAHVNPDYKVRLKPSDILQKALAAKN